MNPHLIIWSYIPKSPDPIHRLWLAIKGHKRDWEWRDIPGQGGAGGDQSKRDKNGKGEGGSKGMSFCFISGSSGDFQIDNFSKLKSCHKWTYTKEKGHPFHKY